MASNTHSEVTAAAREPYSPSSRRSSRACPAGDLDPAAPVVVHHQHQASFDERVDREVDLAHWHLFPARFRRVSRDRSVASPIFEGGEFYQVRFRI